MTQPTLSPCFFCGMEGASAPMPSGEYILHQALCGTTQMVHAHTGEIQATSQHPACKRIAELQEDLQRMKEPAS